MILVLGGTAEARELAGHLDARGVAVTTSLAGRTRAPRRPDGGLRVGGFGGAEGLAVWLAEHRPAAVVDATHPFAVRISQAAAHACSTTATPRLVLRRPGWSPGPGDRWHRVPGAAAAAALAPDLGERVFLALGGGDLAAFAASPGWCLVRAVEPPAAPLPPAHRVVLARGPFGAEAERALLAEHRIDVVVARDSGGTAGAAKLSAAREAGLPVVLLDRPAPPAGDAVASVRAAVAWVLRAPWEDQGR